MGDDGVVRRVEAGGSAAFWEPGSQILWRYRENSGERFHIARPVTVVRDDAELLAVWMAPGTQCVRPVLADGTSLNSVPLASRYKEPRGVRLGRWSGSGVLKLARPGEPWSVWLFWEQGWRFKNWYVNLERPLARWDGGVDSEDHFLDICVYPDRTWNWLDEDEFAQAQQDGLMDAQAAERVREAGHSAVEVIHAWGAPFSDGWQHWRPNPAWGVPSLPDDWDRTPAHLSS
ncbi:DUF402 domain-containing protein [Streptomyces sp. MNU76]|uniref:cytidylyl-2-hydroxypropylphosphonate hydrolase n=1 Tax=Streptomyces sp. MNU76 TaxID=2560026 RepID=UPI001E53825E|nr:DUF402 domain-containing protein [Streptomyces sp. MNU76]MCC9709416.1 DUF402 domain-containing protein [Streptomyces sp. MNU76]